MRTLLRMSIPTVLVLLSVTNVSAQTVRVVASQAVVRLRPDPNSPSIATVQAGAILQVRSREGFWYSVSLPAQDSENILRVGYVSITDVEVFGSSSGSLVTPSLSSLSAGSAPSDDWKSRFDRIQRRRSSGKKKFWIGTIAEGAGLGLLMYWSNQTGISCDYYDCYETGNDGVYYAGLSALMGGAAVSTWGVFQWIFANGDLQALELEMKRNQSTAIMVPQLTVAYTFSW